MHTRARVRIKDGWWNRGSIPNTKKEVYQLADLHIL